MDLLERYLQAVGEHLPPATREDVLAELRANLEAEMAERAGGRETAPTESEVADILKAHGRPMLVAAKYLPQRYLIGPEFFPFYLLTLRKAAPLVVLFYFAGHLASFVFSKSAGVFATSMARAFAQLVPVLLIFWAAVTITFAVLDYVWTQHGKGAGWNAWEPEKLPPLAHPAKQKSLAGRIADLVVHSLWLLYVLAIPRHPYLILGPGSLFLSRLSAGFAPVWRPFYVAIIVLLVAQLIIKLTALTSGNHRSEALLRLLIKLLGLAPTGLLAFATIYFVPTSPTANLHALAQINYGVNLGFRIVFAIALLDLLAESWLYFRHMIPTERLAF